MSVNRLIPSEPQMPLTIVIPEFPNSHTLQFVIHNECVCVISDVLFQKDG